MTALEAAVTIMVAALAGAFSPMIVAYFQRSKNRADTKKADAEAEQSEVDVAQQYKLMVAEQNKEIKALKIRMDELECERDVLYKLVIEWQAGIMLLINQLAANRIEPIWKPRGELPTKPNRS